MSVESRLDSVERRLADVTSRLRQLEGDADAPVATVPPPTPPAPPVEERHWMDTAARPEVAAARWKQEGSSFEEILGGRVLAWVGGLAILLGAALFMAMAIGNGWIDETTRTVLALLGSTGLLGAGLWLYERRGRTEAALAAVASALGGLYATVAVATQAYDLVAPGVGLACAVLIAAAGCAIAVRWQSQIVAAIGMLGAVAAPILAGTAAEDGSILFVGIALAATVGILLWQRWDWLAVGAFLLSAPQLIARATIDNDNALGLTLVALVGFWALYLTAALGWEWRTRSERPLPISSWVLVLFSAALITGLGYYVIDWAGEPQAANAWIIAVAAAHVVLGWVALRLRLDFETGSMLVAIGLGLSAVGLSGILDGPILVAAWAVESVVLAALAASPAAEAEGVAERLAIAATAFLGLATTHVLSVEAPPTALLEGVDDLGDALAGVGLCALAALACGRFLRDVEPLAAKAAAFACAAAAVYLGSIAIVDTIGVSESGEAIQSGQVWLSVFWTVTGLGALVAGLTRGSRSVRLAGLGLLGLAVAKVWTYDLSELDELARVLSFLGLGLLLLVGAYAYQRLRPKAQAEPEPRA